MNSIVMIAALLIQTNANSHTTADLNAWVRTYSTQQIVDLDLNETTVFKLKNGKGRTIKLISVNEHRDTVLNMIRRAEVTLEIEKKRCVLNCEPYQMPTVIDGLRIQADSTKGRDNIPKQVQLSIWDAKEPIIDTKKFVFPIKDHALFSHGMQAFGEAVYLGVGDDDPVGQQFYHDYGFDTAGFEKGEDILSAISGKVVLFWPSREDVCSVVVEDATGFAWEHCHLSAIEPNIQLGAVVKAGQKIGTLGKNGPSGNFSHLHLGTYGRLSDAQPKPGESDIPNKRLNLYPWFVTAYQAQHKRGLSAVARPHHLVKTGEEVVFDGGHSLAWGGPKIVDYRWVFPDGSTRKGIKADKAFDKPGAYVVELWVKDNKGNEDVDFCQVKVYSAQNTEQHMPHIYMSMNPTLDIKPDQPIKFRFWMQGQGGGPIQVKFDDGTTIDAYESYKEITHNFKKPGIHIVSAQCEVDGKPICQKLKVIVIGKP